MHIIDRGRAFRHALRTVATRSVWEWRRCPQCGQTDTWKWGTYPRHPWTLAGRQTVAVQRHWCLRCRRTYSETSALLVRGSWYAREVHRFALDHWLHAGSSLRRTAELVRSLVGHQERWQLWRPLDAPPPLNQQCALGASTVQRWRDRAGQRAEQTVPDHLAGVPSSGQLGTDGLWAKLTGTTKAVVLLLSDSVTGLVYPPVVVPTEDAPAHWGRMFARAATAGLNLETIRGVTSDGARAVATYLAETLVWVHHQRCVFHVWRNLAPPLAEAAATAAHGLGAGAARGVRTAMRRALQALVRAVLDAVDDARAVAALRVLAAHPLGASLAAALRNEVGELLVYREPWNRGLLRVGPEWWWRDYRLRLSGGRNHRTTVRLERAALVWAITHNFEPAQARRERKRCYRRAGHSPLAMAGVPPGEVSYLDALAV